MFDKRLLALVPQAKRDVVLSIVARWLGLLFQTGFFLQLAFYAGGVLSGEGATAPLWRVVLVLVLNAVLFLCAQSVANRLADRAASQVKLTVSTAIFEKTIALGPSRQTVMADSEVQNLMGEGVELLRPYIGKYLPQFFYALLAPVTLFIVGLFIDWPVALVFLICVPLMPGSIMVLMKRAKVFMGEYWGTYVDLGGAFLDAVRGLTTLKVFDTDDVKHRELDEQAEGFRKITMKLLRVQLNSVTFMDLFTYGGIALGLVVTLVQLSSGSISLSNGFVMALLSSGFFLPMRSFGSLFHTGMNATPVIDRLFQLLDAPEPKRGTQELQGAQIHIEAKDLGFSYDGKVPVLENIDLSVFPNAFIGVTGPSGSGKSTLAKLLCGDVVGYTGSLAINGIEVRDIAPASLQKTITVISRSSHLFKGTVRSNLQLARPEASDPQLWEALRRAKVDDFVLDSGGLDAPIAEGGSNLSGGQCQRICFARALLSNTPVYIFDEAASNVDAESERCILEAIQEIALSKTVVVVTHRLNSLRYADQTLVLEHGTAVQTGTHSQLMSQPGIYAQLWKQNEQLEVFAQQVMDQVPKEEYVPTKMEIAMKDAPGMAKNMALAFKQIIEAEKYNRASSGKDPVAAGHPAWIPLPDYEEGVDVAEQTATTDEPAVKTASPKRRSAWQTLLGLLKLTRSRVPELALAALLGALGWFAVAGLFCLAAAGMPYVSATTGVGLLCVGVLVLGVVRGPLHYGERLLTHDQTFRTLALIRSKVFGCLRKLAPAKTESRDSGDLMALLTSDVELLEGFYSRVIAPVTSAVVVAIVLLVVMALLCPLAALVALVACLLVGVVLPWISSALTRKRDAEVHSYSVAMTGFLLDCLQGMPDLLRLGRATEYAQEMRDHLGSLSGGEGNQARTKAVLKALVRFVCLLSMAAMALLLSHCVANQVVAVMVFAMFAVVLQPLSQVADLGFQLHQTLASAQRILDVLEEEPQVAEETEGVVLDGFEGLEIEDVCFGYGDTNVVDDMSLSIEPGTFTGVIGPSGVGKSTLLKLAMRFWDTGSGNIIINGVPVEQVNTASLRKTVGYMTQDTYLFEGTLRQNLLAARPDATEEQLDAAVAAAAMNDLVARLPQGLDTPVNGGGAGLSDGERQRVGLARVFLHDAPLLLLDEPTSNLDSLNEAAVLQALCTGFEGKTVVLVSHRKGIVSIVDKLAVLK